MSDMVDLREWALEQARGQASTADKICEQLVAAYECPYPAEWDNTGVQALFPDRLVWWRHWKYCRHCVASEYRQFAWYYSEVMDQRQANPDNIDDLFLPWELQRQLSTEARRAVEQNPEVQQQNHQEQAGNNGGNIDRLYVRRVDILGGDWRGDLEHAEDPVLPVHDPNSLEDQDNGAVEYIKEGIIDDDDDDDDNGDDSNTEVSYAEEKYESEAGKGDGVNDYKHDNESDGCCSVTDHEDDYLDETNSNGISDFDQDNESDGQGRSISHTVDLDFNATTSELNSNENEDNEYNKSDCESENSESDGSEYNPPTSTTRGKVSSRRPVISAHPPTRKRSHEALENVEDTNAIDNFDGGDVRLSKKPRSNHSGGSKQKRKRQHEDSDEDTNDLEEIGRPWKRSRPESQNLQGQNSQEYFIYHNDIGYDLSALEIDQEAWDLLNQEMKDTIMLGIANNMPSRSRQSGSSRVRSASTRRRAGEKTVPGYNVPSMCSTPSHPALGSESPSKDYPALMSSTQSHPTTGGKTPLEEDKLRRSWTDEEVEALGNEIITQRNIEAAQGVTKPSVDMKLFNTISRKLAARGFDRTSLACKNYWNRYGRSKFGYDERNPTTTPRSLTTSTNRDYRKYKSDAKGSEYNGGEEEEDDEDHKEEYDENVDEENEEQGEEDEDEYEDDEDSY